MQETWVPSLDEEDPLEKGMATYSSVLAWEIPWTEKPGGLQSMGLQTVRYNFTAGHTCMRAMLQWVKRKSSVWHGLSVAFGYLKEHLEVQANNYSFKWKFSIFCHSDKLMSNATLLFTFPPVYRKIQRIINLLQKLLINKGEKDNSMQNKQTNKQAVLCSRRKERWPKRRYAENYPLIVGIQINTEILIEDSWLLFITPKHPMQQNCLCLLPTDMSLFELENFNLNTINPKVNLDWEVNETLKNRDLFFLGCSLWHVGS